MEAEAQWSAAKGADATGSVLNKIDEQHKQMVQRNRQIVASLIRAVLLCARQSIAVPGHRQSKHSSDTDDHVKNGNFVELVHLLEIDSPLLASKLKTMPGNASYM